MEASRFQALLQEPNAPVPYGHHSGNLVSGSMDRSRPCTESAVRCPHRRCWDRLDHLRRRGFRPSTASGLTGVVVGVEPLAGNNPCRTGRRPGPRPGHVNPRGQAGERRVTLPWMSPVFGSTDYSLKRACGN